LGTRTGRSPKGKKEKDQIKEGRKTQGKICEIGSSYSKTARDRQYLKRGRKRKDQKDRSTNEDWGGKGKEREGGKAEEGLWEMKLRKILRG